jgi:hypothetical protein
MSVGGELPFLCQPQPSCLLSFKSVLGLRFGEEMLLLP